MYIYKWHVRLLTQPTNDVSRNTPPTFSPPPFAKKKKKKTATTTTNAHTHKGKKEGEWNRERGRELANLFPSGSKYAWLDFGCRTAETDVSCNATPPSHTNTPPSMHPRRAPLSANRFFFPFH
ncbi:hypothetical protein TCDM_06336 [Trypanosoma cruzi Dm28c]|uniref:Uncharacterized protein n=1 Tax=Trypanosoma cruzi Dm28c TaxID=1416333 RepID=V5DCX9_TRYCR|nr:hypothetical protein TCDM_06336 [Trypanosoma cruzi Dm28c]